MSIQNLLARYSLTARSQGESEETIKHTTRIVGFFDKFMGGITDVAKIQADDLRRFILDTQEKEKWAGLPQAKGQKVSATTVNTYTRAIKGFFKWLNREGIIQTDPFLGVRAPKLPKRLPKVISEKDMIAVFDSVAENPRETALLLLLLDSGITLSGVVELDDSYVDTASGTVRVFREKTAEGNDSLAWMNRKGESVPQSQLAVLRAAECTPETPPIAKNPQHHELVRQGIHHIVQQEKAVGGQLGRPSGARYRSYDRLKRYYDDLKEHEPLLAAREDLVKAIDDIYRYPFRQSATDILNRQMRAGVSDEDLAELVILLRNDDRLSLREDEAERQEPRIICSIGLFKQGG